MDARAELTKAYQTYLGRAPEAGAIDWRIGQLGRNALANQILEIQNSPEARNRSTAAPKPAAAPTPSRVSALTDELTSFDKATKNPIDIYNAALDKLGISDARTRVTALRQSLIDNQNLLDALPGNVQQRTSGAIVTEAQRQRLVAAEPAPIANMGSQINQQFGLAQADEQSILEQGKTTTDLVTQGQQTQRTALLDRLKLAIDKETNEEKKRQWQAEYDRQVALDRQAQANADREYAAARAAAATKSSGGSGGGNGSNTSVSQYSAKKDSSGGTQFTYKGSPVTAAQYYNAVGGSLKQFLQNDPNSKNAYNDYNSGKYTYDQLAKKYPYIFGGV